MNVTEVVTRLGGEHLPVTTAGPWRRISCAEYRQEYVAARGAGRVRTEQCGAGLLVVWVDGRARVASHQPEPGRCAHARAGATAVRYVRGAPSWGPS